MTIRAVATCALGLCLLASCGPTAAAHIDGKEITMSELERELEAMLTNPAYISYVQRTTEKDIVRDGLAAEFVAEVLTIDVTAVVLDDERDRRAVELTPKDHAEGELEASANSGSPSIFRAFPEWHRTELARRAAVRVALRRNLVKGVTPESYYAERRGEFVRPCTRHILVATSGEAVEARNRILGGEPFAEVARDVSLDEGSGPKGGDLGCNSRGHLVGPLDEAALEQPVGEVGEPLRTEEGYHVLQVERREIPALRQIRNRVVGAVAKLARDRLEALARDRLAAAEVTVSDRIGRWNGETVVAR